MTSCVSWTPIALLEKARTMHNHLILSTFSVAASDASMLHKMAEKRLILSANVSQTSHVGRANTPTGLKCPGRLTSEYSLHSTASYHNGNSDGKKRERTLGAEQSKHSRLAAFGSGWRWERSAG